MNRTFKITTIIPIYNTQKYLSETIECILRQSIGFQENIQLILVNDCSTDASGQICEKYSKRYPGNVKYISLEKNSGVSVARNKGLRYAKGKYVNFLDSADMWSDQAYQRMYDYLEENEDVIDMVSSNVWYFEAKEGPHALNQNNLDDRIVDIDRDYKCIRSLGSNCLVKREVAEMFPFHEQQKCWEDSVFINTVILNKKCYGMLAEDVKFYYRCRETHDSASDLLYNKTKHYYLNDLSLLFHGVYESSMKYCGYFAPMCQYFIMNAVHVRFQEEVNPSVLDEKERREYDQILKGILDKIDDKYIREIVYADELTRKLMLAYKYGIDLRKDVRVAMRERDTAYHRLNRTKENNKLLAKWVSCIHSGKTLIPFFKKNNYHKIAIYGISDIGKLLMEELAADDLEICYGVDRNAGAVSVNIPVYKPTDQLPPVDVIVVTAVYFFDEIYDTLRKNGVNDPIVSLNDVLDMVQQGEKYGKAIDSGANL